MWCWTHFQNNPESGVFFAYSYFILGTIIPLKYFSKTEVLVQGGITPRIVIPYPLAYDDALNACAHMGQGQLPDPANMAAWRALLNTTALQMGERWTDPFDLWLPYKSPPGKNNSEPKVYCKKYYCTCFLYSAGAGHNHFDAGNIHYEAIGRGGP